MFIKYTTVNKLAGDDASSEISTFEGIRYEQEAEIAILSTEHVAHDYLLPMKKGVYEVFVRKLYEMISETIKNPGLMIVITGSPVLRVKHGSLTRYGGMDQYRYGLDFSASVQ